MCDGLAFFSFYLDGRAYGTVRSTPANDEEITFFDSLHCGGRDVVCDAVDFRLAHFYHELMVLRIVAHVAGDMLLLKSADAVFETRCAGDCPGSRKRFLVALVWIKAFRVGSECRRNIG